MAFSDATHASLVAICLRAPALNHQSEAARILAIDKLATLVDAGRAPSRVNADAQFLFDTIAVGQQPLPVALDVACTSVSGPALAERLWFCRTANYGGGIAGEAYFESLVGYVEPPATAEAAWRARVDEARGRVTALIAAAAGTFDLTGTRDELLALDALNPAADSEAWLDLYESLFP